jgi:polyadenylate-binding protein
MPNSMPPNSMPMAALPQMQVAPNAPPAAQVGPTGAPASLYVGDLHPEVTEADLFERFNSIGAVLSIRVCRDAVSRRSLGYAYVNFQMRDDAETAIELLNFEAIKGRPCRIMWSQRDPFMRRSGAGNIFIRNLAKDIDIKMLYDTFVQFGKILSCKVATDENGESKGYAFVHFEREEDALNAIDKVDKKLIRDQEVHVAKFLSRKEREASNGGASRFTNVYVKNLPLDMDVPGFKAKFGEVGEVTSAIIMLGEDNKSRGFGFINFAEPEDAQRAVDKFNNLTLEGAESPLYVGRAQKKRERVKLLQQEFESKRRAQDAKYQGVNLYVKHLDESVTEDMLREAFEKNNYGTITSVKIMTDEKGTSRGFGFVCYSQPDEATKAIQMNSQPLCGKPLYVAQAVTKAERQRQLQNQRAARQQQMMPNFSAFPMGPGMPPHNMAFYNPQMMGAFPRFRPGNFKQAAMMGMQMPMAPMRMPGPPMGAPQQQQQQQQQRARGNRGTGPSSGNRSVGGGRGAMRGAGGFNPQQQQQQQQQQQRMAGMHPMQMGMPPAGMNGQRPQPQVQQQQQQPSTGQIDPSRLANADPKVAKTMLGEALFPKIQKLYPEDASKLTGMLLEMDNAELVQMTEEEETLNDRVHTAYQVLQEHKRQASANPTASASADINAAAGNNNANNKAAGTTN